MQKRAALLADQASNSLATFLVSVYAARALEVEGYGVFSLLFVAVVLLVGLTRAAFSDPLLLTAGEADAAGLLPAHVAHHARTLMLLSSALLLVAGAVAFASATAAAAMVALSIAVVADYARFVCMVGERFWTLATLSLSALVVVVLSGGLSDWVHVNWSPEIFLLFYAMSGIPGYLFVLWTQFLSRRKVAKDYRSTRPSGGVSAKLAGDYALGIASSQATLWVASLLVGPTAAAALRGAETVLGPLRSLIAVANSLLLSPARRRYRVGQPVYPTLVAPVLLLILVAWAWALFISLPRFGVGPALLGDSWSSAEGVLPWVALAFTAATVTQFATIGIKARDKLKSLIRLRLVFVPVSVGSGVTGAILQGAPGAAMGSALASCLAAALWTTLFLREDFRALGPEDSGH